MSRSDLAYLHLRTAIEQGQYPEGCALPTQPALARTIGVSTVTLRQALERLAEEGFIEARQGHGTFVRSSRSLRGPVLVADDDRGVREVLVDSLRHLGYEVEAVESGERAIERAARRRFTHILLDVRMGQMGGVAAAELIGRLDGGAVIVFVTAHPIDLLKREQGVPWPALVLRKPFDINELERVLQLKVQR